MSDKAGKSYRGMKMTAWDWKVAGTRSNPAVWLEEQFLLWVRYRRKRV